MKLVITSLVTILSLATAGHAETSAPDVHLDIEVDPTAYVLSGYSVHVGAGWKHIRLDLGVYAMDLPELLHGNPGWDASFDGAGAKLQWFPFASQRGGYVDISAGVARQRVTLRETGASRRDTSFGAGIDFGYRFVLPYNFYVTPWAGLSYDFNAGDVMLDGHTYEKTKWIPFAAVHLGFRFR